MNVAWLSKRLHGLLSRAAWLLILAALVFVLLAIMTWSRSASKRVAVDIRVNTNGIATILGIPLGSGSVRDLTLRVLSGAHVPVRVIVPSGGSAAPGWDTNAVQTMSAIIKAGLVPTNKPAGPSPYE
jgi:hypothetical protein